jgi:LysM repeat protein
MNTPNPLQPQGTLSKDTKSRTNIRIAVFTILAVHVVLLLGLLVQGCNREGKKEARDTFFPTNSLPALASDSPYGMTNTGVDSAVGPAAGTPGPNSIAYEQPAVGSLPAATPTPTPLPTPIAPASDMAEYSVVRGDSFYKIAKAKGVSMRALAEANPGVDSTKLRIGQKLMIPAGDVGLPAAPASVAHATEADASGAAGSVGDRVYTVKAGDSLARIARQHGTSVRAIQTANNLKTTQIKIGQRLKVPSAKMAAAAHDATASAVMTAAATSNLTPTSAPAAGAPKP